MKKYSTLALFLLFAFSASAAPVSNITVKGNQRVDSESVKSYMIIKQGDELDLEKINKSIKALFATGLFSEANITPQNDGLLVEVLENPIINQVAFEGNKIIDDEKLAGEVSLKTRSLYTKAAVQENIQRIAEIYRKSGRYNAKITPKVILKDQNRIDLIFEIEEGKETYIEKVVFIGNKAFADSDLEKIVRSKEYAWWQILSSDDTYDSDRIEFDKELLRKHYTNNGYADFRVKSAIAELLPDKTGAVLTFSVDEGAKYKFNKIQVITQLTEIDTKNFDEDVVRTKEGKNYDAGKIENTVDNLVEKAGEKGFAFVDVDPQISRDNEAKTIDVTYVIKEGPKVYVDRININGNVRTLDKVVRREMKLSEGDPFNTSLLKRSRQRIENLDYFKKVDISQQKSTTATDKLNIDINVEEKSTGEINFGAGYSTTDGALFQSGIKEKNFLGRGQNVSLNADVATRRQQGQFSFTEPYFLDENVAAGFDLFKTRNNLTSQSSYLQDSTGLTLRTGYDITEHLRHSLHYSIVNDQITDVASNASLFIQLQEGTSLTSLIGQDFVYDMLDNRMNPRDGYLLSLSQDLAGLGGDNKFIRHEVKAGYYIPLTESKSWAASFIGTAGNVTGIGKDVRINNRFYIGGQSFRGFDRGGIGPRDEATGDALGGNNYYVLTSELGFPLSVSDELGLRGALFADLGSAWGIDQKGNGIIDNKSPRLTVGTGIAWDSPFGPIRVDFGFPVISQKEDQKQIFQLNFGTRF